jgi:hypothetical protein
MAEPNWKQQKANFAREEGKKKFAEFFSSSKLG